MNKSPTPPNRPAPPAEDSAAIDNALWLASIVESSDDAIITKSLTGTILSWNIGAERIYGYSADEAIGKNISILIPPELAPELPSILKRLARGQRVSHFETQRLRKDGKRITISLTLSPLKDAQGRVIAASAIARDVTADRAAREALRQMHAELERRVQQRTEEIRNLASQLTLAEQRERRRLAEVLHDELQQLLVGMRYRTESLKRAGDGAVREAAGEIATLIAQCLSVSRSLTAELNPPILQHNNALVPALQWLGRWMHEKHGLNVEIEVFEPVQPPGQDVTLLVFRSVRELLFNVVKHAKVDIARVTLMSTGDYLQTEVSDNGVGFDPFSMSAQSASSGGFGLGSIRDRLELLGGCLEIHAQCGRGSRFILYAPAPVPVPQEQLAP